MNRFPEDDVTSKNPTIIESFQWMRDISDFKSESWGEKAIRIKGRALTSGAVSKNNRKYVDEELKKSARTLVGRPLNINHDDSVIVGNVDWAEYEDQAIEFLATVKKEPYISMIKAKDPKLKGVSVQADYLKTVCSRCGKSFLSEADWKRHMVDEEFMKVSGEPHGIHFNALSLVLAPESPGVPGADFQIAESMNGEMRLFETIIAEKGAVVDPSGLAIAAPETLKLGEPFAGYANFADCVSKNQDKMNPEAYCGSIKHEAEAVTKDDSPSEMLKELEGLLVFGTRERTLLDAIITVADRSVREARLSLSNAPKELLEVRAKLELSETRRQEESANTKKLQEELAHALDQICSLQKRATVSENLADKLQAHAEFRGRQKEILKQKMDW